MAETTGVPFTPAIVRGFVTSAVMEYDRWFITLTGLDRSFWIKRGERVPRVGDDITLELDGDVIIGVLLRLV